MEFTAVVSGVRWVLVRYCAVVCLYQWFNYFQILLWGAVKNVLQPIKPDL